MFPGRRDFEVPVRFFNEAEIFALFGAPPRFVELFVESASGEFPYFPDYIRNLLFSYAARDGCDENGKCSLALRAEGSDEISNFVSLYRWNMIPKDLLRSRIKGFRAPYLSYCFHE